MVTFGPYGGPRSCSLKTPKRHGNCDSFGCSWRSWKGWVELSQSHRVFFLPKITVQNTGSPKMLSGNFVHFFLFTTNQAVICWTMFCHSCHLILYFFPFWNASDQHKTHIFSVKLTPVKFPFSPTFFFFLFHCIRQKIQSSEKTLLTPNRNPTYTRH